MNAEQTVNLDCLFENDSQVKNILKTGQHVECYDNQNGSDRTPKVIFLWHTLHLAVFQGRISEFMTKALRTTQAC